MCIRDSPHSDAPVLRSTAMPSQKPRPVRSVFEKIRNVQMCIRNSFGRGFSVPVNTEDL